jgi:16S rRNA (cytosine967-C5)-methyltransferase
VDAPCSGTGTLRRRPEILIHREACDLARLSDLQVAIVRRAATRARDGGRVVFAVCSVLREEAEEVMRRLVEAPPDVASGVASDVASDAPLELVPEPFEAGVAPVETSVRLLPHVHGTDGYFIASFRVQR